MFKNSRKAYQIYRKLTDEEKEIIEKRKVSGKHSIREWNRKLSHIALMDSYADKARGGLKTMLILSLFLTFFVRTVTVICTGWGELTKFVTNHAIRYQYRNEFFPVVNTECQTDKMRQNS